MHLLYFDEVKHDPPAQKSYWLGAVSASYTSISQIENEISSISEEPFGSRILTKNTEFHGIDICRGKGNFKGRSIEDRLEILKKLLNVLSRQEISRITIKINPENLVYTSNKPDEIAFMFLIEQADILFSENNTIGMLFGDYDGEVIAKSVASLSSYKASGTNWRSRQIQNIIDTVHFAKSHHSRMIQLADIFLYCQQFISATDNSSGWRSLFANAMRESGAMVCTKRKTWPTEPVWYR